MSKDRLIDLIFKTFAVIGLVSVIVVASAIAGYWWAKVGEFQFITSKAMCGSCRIAVK